MPCRITAMKKRPTLKASELFQLQKVGQASESVQVKLKPRVGASSLHETIGDYFNKMVRYFTNIFRIY